MCLAIPARILAIDSASDTATVALGAVSRSISLALVEDVAVGDYVLIHVGYALNKISEEEAERTLALMAEMGVIEDDLDGHPPAPGDDRPIDHPPSNGMPPHGDRT
jgi:hydrogenase expression/formation protein HypC